MEHVGGVEPCVVRPRDVHDIAAGFRMRRHLRLERLATPVDAVGHQTKLPASNKASEGVNGDERFDICT